MIENPKVNVGTGWWCSDEDSPWRIGTARAKRAEFFEIWNRQVRNCLSPDRIVIVDSASPIKCPVSENEGDTVIIPLDRNYGHANDIRTGKILTHFCGFTRSVMMSAMYALSCDADIYVYVEQDCLLFGKKFLSAALDEISEDIILGHPTQRGRGLFGRVAAPMLQQSLMIVRRTGLPRFIDGLASAPWTDGEQSPEETMRLRLPPYGLLAVSCGKSRPVDFTLKHFYVAAFSDEELDQALALVSVTPQD